MLPLTLATQARAISQSSSADKLACTWRLPSAALTSASPPDFKKPILSLGIAQFSATIHEHWSPYLTICGFEQYRDRLKEIGARIGSNQAGLPQRQKLDAFRSGMKELFLSLRRRLRLKITRTLP